MSEPVDLSALDPSADTEAWETRIAETVEGASLEVDLSPLLPSALAASAFAPPASVPSASARDEALVSSLVDASEHGALDLSALAPAERDDAAVASLVDRADAFGRREGSAMFSGSAAPRGQPSHEETPSGGLTLSPLLQLAPRALAAAAALAAATWIWVWVDPPTDNPVASDPAIALMAWAEDGGSLDAVPLRPVTDPPP